MNSTEKEIRLKELRKKQKIARARLKEMNESGLGDSRTVRDAMGAWYVVSKRDNFTIPKGVSDGRTINAMHNALDKFLASKWTTPEGREEIRSKMRSSLGKTLYMTDEQVNGLLDIFQDEVYDDFKELAYSIGSELVFPWLSELKESYNRQDISDALKHVVHNQKSVLRAEHDLQFDKLQETVQEYLNSLYDDME